MPETEAFFNSDLFRQAVAMAKGRGSAPSTPWLTRARVVIFDALDVMTVMGDEFDLNTRISLSHNGQSLRKLLITVDMDYDAWLEEMLVQLYRLCIEYSLSVVNDLPNAIHELNDFVQTNDRHFSSQNQARLQFARTGLPIALFKELFHSSETVKFRNVEEFSHKTDERLTKWDQETNDKLAAWEQAFKEKEDRVNKLAGNLSEVEAQYNLVKLNEGFKSIQDVKEKQLARAIWLVAALGAAVLAPIVFEIFFLLQHLSGPITVERINLFAVGVPMVTLTLVLIYYFRIALRNAESYRSQILQIQLRRTLCTFIQSYSDYAGNLGKDHRESLAKFENIVFSGIVATDEKIPSTFDGLEQIANLLKATRGGKD